jgi:uncharacterized protein (DUF305 family)
LKGTPQHTTAERWREKLAFEGRGGFLVPMLFLAVVLLAGLALWLFFANRPPADNSAEAGFARDMMVHHAQAVEMAEILRDRTESDEMRLMVADVALTQQAQIGRMEGWLAVWGLPATGNEPAMSWMGHPTEGRMPGMASPEQIEELRELPPEVADVRFLQLMIPHHEAALAMSEAALERTDRPDVVRIARAIAASQEAEIEVMQDLLRDRGATPEEEPRTPDVAAEGGHDHH